MGNVAPSLLLLWEVRRSLEKGQSVGVGVNTYLKLYSGCEFHMEVDNWWAIYRNGQKAYDKSRLSHSRQFLLDVLEAGLKGHSILKTLNSLEDELILSCEAEIERHIAKLPLLSLLPLLLFIFPSMMIVLITPLLKIFFVQL